MATPTDRPSARIPGGAAPQRRPEPQSRSRRRGSSPAQPAPQQRGARAVATRVWQLLVLAMVIIPLSLLLSGLFFGLVGLLLAFG